MTAERIERWEVVVPSAIGRGFEIRDNVTGEVLRRDYSTRQSAKRAADRFNEKETNCIQQGREAALAELAHPNCSLCHGRGHLVMHERAIKRGGWSNVDRVCPCLGKRPANPSQTQEAGR